MTEEEAEAVEQTMKKRLNESLREMRRSKQASRGGKDEEEENVLKINKTKSFSLLHDQIANAIAYVPVVKSDVDSQQEREGAEHRWRNWGMREEGRAGWMDAGGRREPGDRMPSCLANRKQAVEAHSTLFTSSFVLHPIYHMSLFLTQRIHYCIKIEPGCF